MIYVYDVRNFEDAEIQEVINSGLAVAFDTDELVKVLSKSDSLKIGDKVIAPSEKLEDWLEYCDGGEYVDIVSVTGETLLQPSMSESIEVLQDCLYVDRGNEKPTYADRIYNSDNPHEEIRRVLSECILIVLDMKIDEIQSAAEGIRLRIKEQTFEWD